jgi:HPt (histidine-containing phosphotransfer) domain-containing protein
MGMTATEFIARSAYRPSYLAHASASLGPLIIVLLSQGEPYSGMTALLVFCFGAVLAGYCGRVAKLLDESIRLRLTNIELVRKLLAEKKQTEDAAPAPSTEETQTAIDAAAFAALEKKVGSTTLIEILKSYIETAEQLCTALQAASGDANWNEAARLAQDIAGSASGLGLMAMTAAARGFAQATRQGASAHALRNDAQLIVTEHERVRRELAKMYPDLVA